MTITAMEQAISSAERRAMVNNEAKTTLRVSDLFSMVPALTGKLELVYEGEQRSEEHTSELQSRGHLVCRLLLEKKNTVTRQKTQIHIRTRSGKIHHNNCNW